MGHCSFRNNAGVYSPNLEFSEQKVEITFATNYLGKLTFPQGIFSHFDSILQKFGQVDPKGMFPTFHMFKVAPLSSTQTTLLIILCTRPVKDP